MKWVFLLLILSSPVFAAQKYDFKDPKLDDEMSNNYKEHKYPNWINARGSSMTVTYIHVSTITLNGVNLSAAASFQTPVISNTSTAFTTTSTSFQTTNCTATITPLSASHRIKITVTGTLSSTNGLTTNAFATIARGTTDLSSGNGFAQLDIGLASFNYVPCSMSFIDSPGTTSAVTYNVRIKSDATATIGFGAASGTNPNQIMILEEIL